MEAAMSDVRRARASARGMSAIDVLVALALVSIAGGFAMASVSPEVQQVHEEAAARYVAMRVRQARAEALQRSASVGIRFEQDGDRTQFRLYVDGNGNGLRTREVLDNTDRPLGPAQRLESDFGGAGFGIASALPPIEPRGDRLEAGADPIRVGASRILTFGPTGRGSSGTLYIRGRGGQQFAVRIYGPTGRVRLLKFRPADGQWIER
jgi:type II secretory pathway pseudopilin PulG